MKPKHTSTQRINRMLPSVAFALIGLAIFLPVLLVQAQQEKKGSTTDDSFKKYGQEVKGKIGKSYEESKEWWPEAPKPKPGTPNVLIILLDDVGFAHIGSYGGLIETPNIDKLAANGLRYNNFHTTALCSPSRAALMAGGNPHKIGFGSHQLTAMR